MAIDEKRLKELEEKVETTSRINAELLEREKAAISRAAEAQAQLDKIEQEKQAEEAKLKEQELEALKQKEIQDLVDKKIAEAMANQNSLGSVNLSVEDQKETLVDTPEEETKPQSDEKEVSPEQKRILASMNI